MLTFGSLFAGIGGFDLGFERAGISLRRKIAQAMNEDIRDDLRGEWERYD